MTYPALQLVNSRKQKRVRFSEKYRNDGIRLAEQLRATQKDFPRFAAQLNQLIERIIQDALRTRTTDQRRVIETLKTWSELTQQEIMEDTGLSHWDVRQTLYELIEKGTVGTRPQQLPLQNPTRCRTLYFLKQVTRDSK